MQSAPKTEYYFRWSATVTFFEESVFSRKGISVGYHCSKYPVTKRTRAGAFIDDYGRKRFILNDAKKKWAAPTKQEAWINYKARCRFAVVHARNNLEKIESAMATETFAKHDYPIKDVVENTNHTVEVFDEV